MATLCCTSSVHFVVKGLSGLASGQRIVAVRSCCALRMDRQGRLQVRQLRPIQPDQAHCPPGSSTWSEVKPRRLKNCGFRAAQQAKLKARPQRWAERWTIKIHVPQETAAHSAPDGLTNLSNIQTSQHLELDGKGDQFDLQAALGSFESIGV